MRNPYTVFESTRSFFTNTIQPLKLQDISNEELQENILSVYAKLYHKYEADKKFIPEGNLVEVRFEDYETNAFDMTQEIYQKLQIPGFEDARTDIEAYVNKKKGYKKNKYQYKPETVELVERTGRSPWSSGGINCKTKLNRTKMRDIRSAFFVTHSPICLLTYDSESYSRFR